MSDRTLSSRASLFTEDRAEDPGREGKNISQIILKPPKNHFLLISELIQFKNANFKAQISLIACHTWCSASVDEGIFRSGLLLIKVKLSWSQGPRKKKE